MFCTGNALGRHVRDSMLSLQRSTTSLRCLKWIVKIETINTVCCTWSKTGAKNGSRYDIIEAAIDGFESALPLLLNDIILLLKAAKILKGKRKQDGETIILPLNRGVDRPHQTDYPPQNYQCYRKHMSSMNPLRATSVVVAPSRFACPNSFFLPTKNQPSSSQKKKKEETPQFPE